MLEEALKEDLPIELGVPLIKALDISISERETPETENKVIEIMNYLKDHPEPMFVIEMTKHNDGKMSNLEFLLGYTKLNKQRIEKQGELDELNKKIKFYEGY